MKQETLVTGRAVWPRLRRAALAQRTGIVAVAFLAKGAFQRLPLAKGSHLVVNAGNEALRAGMTSPYEIEKYDRAKVKIFTSPNLHAKVFIFGKSAFVGSANVSHSSENRLTEAVIETSSRTVVALATRFIRSLKAVRIGPELIKEMKKLYKEPKFEIHGASRSLKISDGVWVVT